MNVLMILILIISHVYIVVQTVIVVITYIIAYNAITLLTRNP